MSVKNYAKALEDIKSTVSIADVIGSVVSLKRSGTSYMGCCPFHKEKTPSFSVNDGKGFYHCFGCGESGDVVKFVQKYYNLDFPSAVEKLAAQYAITIEEIKGREDSKNDAYYEANRLAARYFFKQISSQANRGYDYFTARGIKPDTIKHFGLGWSGEDATGLTKHLLANGVEKQTLIDLGLSGQNGDRLYDKFRSRVIFPIINVRGKVIGFGGRNLGPEKPKYLNSNESSIYLKKNNLFGINRSKDAILREGYAIIVEGYMDCISLYQSGIENVVASCGTALTPEQAKLLGRYAKSVVLCYDSDNAGIKAALRGIDVLRAAEMDVKVLNVDDGKDPDEYVQKNGKEAFLNLIKEKTVSDIDYKVSMMKNSYDLKDHTQGIKFYRALAGIIHGLDPVEADVYIKKYSREYGISEGALRREAEGFSTDHTDQAPAFRAPSQEGEKPPEKLNPADVNLERMLIKLIMLKSSCFERLKDYPEAFVTEKGKAIRSALEDLYKDCQEFDLKTVQSALDEETAEHLAAITDRIEIGEEDKAFSDCLDRLEAKRRGKRISQIMTILEMADSMPEEAVDQNQIKDLLTELDHLQKINKGDK